MSPYREMKLMAEASESNRLETQAKLDRVTAERNALQLMLNDLEEQVHSLEQRRHAEQQACQAAERRVEELEELLSIAQQYITDLASSLENACEFFEGNEEDDPQATEECEEARAFTMRIDAALNPTAEAVSHE